MRKFLIFIIILLSVIVVGEIVYYFVLAQKETLPSSPSKQVTSTPIQTPTIQQSGYKPIKEYSGSVVSLKPGTNGFEYKLTYISSQTNTEEAIFIGPQEADMTTLQYFNSEKELISEEKGIQSNSLQPQDKFDIIVSDFKKEDVNPENPLSYKVDEIVIKIYR